ncbi:MAG: 6-hydroxymethylpterin diphosphokinase MptE-like protein [Muribaculaceae bacterium]
MTKTLSDPTVSGLQNVVDSFLAIGKMLLQSRPTKIAKVSGDKPLIIMGNGPSLRQTLTDYAELLKKSETLAVNFAANSPEFFEIKPKYYVLADPHFFKGKGNDNVRRLYENLAKVDWNMTLFIPRKENAAELSNLTIEKFNMVGIEGWHQIQNFAFTHALAMPRPRNVLIASIMVAIFKGFKEIYLVGADHSWLQTISVNEQNEVVSIQPHFYKEEKKEETRIKSEYSAYPLHQIIYSFYIAFRAYHQIRRYADTHAITIYNATPASFIDAFERKNLPQ